MSTSVTVKSRLAMFEQDSGGGGGAISAAGNKPLPPALLKFKQMQENNQQRDLPGSASKITSSLSSLASAKSPPSLPSSTYAPTSNKPPPPNKPKPAGGEKPALASKVVLKPTQKGNNLTKPTGKFSSNNNSPSKDDNDSKSDLNQNVISRSGLAATIAAAAASKQNSNCLNKSDDSKESNDSQSQSGTFVKPQLKPTASTLSISSTSSSSSATSSKYSPSTKRALTPPTKPSNNLSPKPSYSSIESAKLSGSTNNEKENDIDKVKPSLTANEYLSNGSGSTYDKTIIASPAEEDTPSVSGLKNSFEKSSTESLSKNLHKKSPSKSPSPPKQEPKEEEETILRQADGQRFKKLKLTEDLSPAPELPSLPDDLDLSKLLQQYQLAVARLVENQSKSQESSSQNPGRPINDEDDGEIYDDCSSTDIEAIRPKPNVPSNEENRVSIIPEMTEEEEFEEGEVYDDCVSPHSPMSPGSSSSISSVPSPREAPQMDPIADDIYELEEDEVIEAQQEETEQEKKIRLKKEEELRKKEERERKKEEEKRKKNEKTLKKTRSKFKLTGEEIPVGEGTIIADARGRGENMTVKKGQIVTIVRMDQNPTHKWLVSIDNTYGYVDSSNIHINTAVIKETMVKKRKESSALSSTSGEDPHGRMYDDVPDEEGDIYEAFD